MTLNRSLLRRKTLICLIVGIGAVWARADQPTTGTPTITISSNSGFEDWQPAPADLQKLMDCPQLPTGWNIISGNLQSYYSLRCDTAIKHGGNSSLRLSNTNTKGGFLIGQRMAAEPEYRYKIDLWLKGNQIDAYFPKGVIVNLVASSISDKNDLHGGDGNLFASFKIPAPNSGTFDWHECIFTFDTPVNTQTILFSVELRGAGTLWLDDVQVTRLERCLQVESY